MKLSKGADGSIAAKEVFFTPRMKNHHGGMIVVGDCLYGAAGGNEGGYLVCLDLATGKQLWMEREAPKGALTLADGRLYLRTERGPMVLIEPNRERFVERGRFEQPERTRDPAWAHPVIANGKLLPPGPGPPALLRREGALAHVVACSRAIAAAAARRSRGSTSTSHTRTENAR